MRSVRCYDCGKSYDYDEDCFCPKCGAFNQPPEGAFAMRRRVDGLSESGHEGSFLHREFHKEERQRRRTGLDAEKGDTAGAQVLQAMKRAARERPAAPGGRAALDAAQERKQAKPAAPPILRIVWGLMLLWIVLNAIQVIARLLIF